MLLRPGRGGAARIPALCGETLDPADPHLLAAESARVGVFLAPHEGVVDGEDRCRGDAVGQLEGAVHRVHVGGDELGVAAEFRLRQLSSTKALARAVMFFDLG